MMRGARRFLVRLGVVVVLVTPVAAQDAPLFSVYPTYRAKFNIATEKFSLVSSAVIYNISGQTFTDVTFKQTYAEGITVKETYQREVGTAETGEQSSARRVENNAFFASTPSYKNRQYVVIFNELDLARRLNQITFPGVEIAYTDPQGKPQQAKLQPNTYDLFIYSNVVGGLDRFLKQYNKISFDFAKATPQRQEWEFAPIVASAQGRFPTGIIGTFPGEDQYNGYFRLLSGPPGDNLQLVVVYKGIDKKEKVADQETLLKRLREHLRWCGEFEFATDGLQVTRGEWKKYDDTWSVEGRWLDTVKSRLGEGPALARVFFGPREDVEYFVLALGHGRKLGAEGSATPNPEKESQLLAEMKALVESFRSSIIPLSHDRRR